MRVSMMKLQIKKKRSKMARLSVRLKGRIKQ